MVAPISKIVRRISGFMVGDKPLTVSLIPGGSIQLKPLGSPKAEEVSVNADALYELLRKPQGSESAEPTSDLGVVLKRLKELIPIKVADDPDSQMIGPKLQYAAHGILAAAIRHMEQDLQDLKDEQQATP
jgi:hypothetical protein